MNKGLADLFTNLYRVYRNQGRFSKLGITMLAALTLASMIYGFVSMLVGCSPAPATPEPETEYFDASTLIDPQFVPQTQPHDPTEEVFDPFWDVNEAKEEMEKLYWEVKIMEQIITLDAMIADEDTPEIQEYLEGLREDAIYYLKTGKTKLVEPNN